MNGNPGVLAAIQATPYGTGYVEGAYAKSANPAVGQAYLQNGQNSKGAISSARRTSSRNVNALKHVTSANITYGEGSDEVPLGTSTPWCILYVDPSNFISPPAKTYPIVGISYMLFYARTTACTSRTSRP